MSSFRFVAGQRVKVADTFRIPKMRGDAYIIEHVTPEGLYWARLDKTFSCKRRIQKDGRHVYVAVQERPNWTTLFSEGDLCEVAQGE